MKKTVLLGVALTAIINAPLMADEIPDFDRYRDSSIKDCKMLPKFYGSVESPCEVDDEICEKGFQDIASIDPAECPALVDGVISQLMLDPEINPDVDPASAKLFYERVGSVKAMLAYLMIIRMINDDFVPTDKDDIIADITFPEEKINSNSATSSPPLAPTLNNGPQFVAPKLDISSLDITVSDKDAQPLVRIPGLMPANAHKSGHCEMVFDVDTSGKPFNIVARYCTHQIFKENSVDAVSKFKYRPKIANGKAVPMRGVETKTIYRLLDENGNIIPE